MLPLDISEEAVPESVDNSIKTLTSRLASILQSGQYSGDIVGVAAGDEPKNKHGVWFSTFYGKANQGGYSSTVPYKTKTYGNTLGVDTMVSEDVTAGISFTLANTDVKNYDTKGGDKGKTTTKLISLYGLTTFANNWFLQGLAFYSFNDLKSQENRLITSTITQTAVAKFKSKAFGGQLIGGKQHQLTKSVVLSPMIGIRYNKFDDNAYKESGASIQNLSVGKKSNYLVEGIIGGKLIGRAEINNNIVIKPEIQAFANCTLKSKASAIYARLDSMNVPLVIRAPKASSAWYSLGGAVTIEHKNMEYVFLYERELDKKYISNQGLFKLRVNF